MKKRNVSILFIVSMIIMLLSCKTSTSVTFNTNVPGASVYVDGVNIGVTPVTTKLSNAIWEDPDILIRMEGHFDYRGEVNKEAKVGNIISGVLFFWPFLWCYGPKANQNFVLTPNAK